MAPKYTILKALLQNLNKVDKQIKGFTLLELIIGLSIMFIVGGLAMNAFVQSSITFNKDKKAIDSNQNLSAILETIGSDIRQSGENINDPNFPVIEFAENTADGSMSKSSKITIRRALTSRLTLCQSGLTPTSTSIIVADNLTATVNTAGGSNCDVGTSSSPLSIYRVPPTAGTATTYFPTAAATALPTTPTPLLLKLPLALRQIRDYRCQLDNLNPTTAYDSPANAGTDFCDVATIPSAEKLRIAVSSSDGQLLIFNQTGEVADITSDTSVNASTITTSTKKYSITVNNTFSAGSPGNATAVPPVLAVPADSAIANNTKNSVAAVTYNIGDPIYVIEERVYTLASDGSFKVSVNGAPPQTLIKKLANFRASARTYTNATDRVVQSTPTADVCTVPTGTNFAAQPTAPTVSDPQYICKFNYFTGVTTADKANWKTIAGVKIELQAKYDGTGQSATASDADLAKLAAAAEFFPRNVLSK